MRRLEKCVCCGKQYIVLAGSPKYCRDCNKAWNEEKKLRQEESERIKWIKQRQINQEIFEKEIQKREHISVNDIPTCKRNLCIIGNGFDLMHRVPSSYYGFRDSLGKNNNLRWTLEIALTPEDIWADFEESLGHLNIDLMGSRHIVEMWLDDFRYFSDEDADAAEFYMAVEAAANLIISITDDLQPAFRRWVEKLKTGTEDRPLKDLFRSDCKVLCFNYTEFAESLYGVKDICYIHGCRKCKKQKLILGHSPDAVLELYEKERKPRNYRQAVVDVAQDNVLDLIRQYDEELTKNSKDIIASHKDFFESLTDIEQIVVIGHSLSPVDWDYFSEISTYARNAVWYFGCHGLSDLKNVEALVKRLGIKDFHLFRTDTIRTDPIESYEKPELLPELKQRLFQFKDIRITEQGFNLSITDKSEQYEVELPDKVKKLFYIKGHLFVILNDLENNILLFSRDNGSWDYVDCLSSFEHQGLINRRLVHIFMTNTDIMFVYNNRVRKYDLQTGQMICNQHVRGAGNMEYPGEDVVEMFIRHQK